MENQNNCVELETTSTVEKENSSTTETVIYKREVVEIETCIEKVEEVVSTGHRIQNIYAESDGTTRKKSLNKSAYIKLHRSSLNGPKSNNVDALKQKYESNAVDNKCANVDSASPNSSDNGGTIIKDQINGEATPLADSEVGPSGDKTETNENGRNIITKTTDNIEKLQNKLSSKLPVQAVESLRKKYSPASYGYPKLSSLPSPEIRTKKVTFAPTPPSIKPTPPPRNNSRLSSPTEKHVVVIKEVTSPAQSPILTRSPINLQSPTLKFETPERDSVENKKPARVEKGEILENKNTENNKQETVEIQQEKPEEEQKEVALKQRPNPRKISLHIEISNPKRSDSSPPIPSPRTLPSPSKRPTSDQPKDTQTDNKTEEKTIQTTLERKTKLSDSETQTDLFKLTKPKVAPKPVFQDFIPKRPFSSIEVRKPQPRPSAPRRPISNIETEKKHLPITLSEDDIGRDNIIFADPEDIHLIVRRSSSEDSEAEINKVKNFLDDIDTMDGKKKEKKRSSSFRKILTGGFFSKDKKKEEDKKKPKEDDRKVKTKKVDNNVFSDNVQNESNFNRNSAHRHTVDNSSSYSRERGSSVTRNAQENFPYGDDRFKASQSSKLQDQCVPKDRGNTSPPSDPKEIEARFAEMHVNRYNQIRDQFTHKNLNQRYEGYVDMDNSNSKRGKENYSNTNVNINAINRYIDTSSSNTISSESRSDTYENALIAQAEMMQRREQELKMQTEKNDRAQNRANARNRFFGNNENHSPEPFSATPPRAHDTYQNLQLIKPKALIPINSERPLPNPYHNGQTIEEKTEESGNKTIDRNLNMGDNKDLGVKTTVSDQPKEGTDNVYGTVYDLKSVSAQMVISRNQQGLTTSTKEPKHEPSRPMSPISPKSLEASKLRLPSNREKVDLQPRIKSPIPQTKISTDKIIATELLKNKKDDKRTTPSHQRLEIEIDYPESGSLSPRNFSSPSSTYSPNRTISQGQLSPRNRLPDSPSNRLRSPVEKIDFLNSTQRVRSPIPVEVTRPLSPRETIDQHLEAAEWQRKQREVAASPSLIALPNQQTEVIVHTENSNQLRNNNMNVRSDTPSMQARSPILYTYSPSSLSPRSGKPSTQDIRASTPVNLPQSLKLHSPSKAEMRQQVEAFCWKELKKLKQREEQEIYQIQLSNYGYAEDPVISRRCRSVSPTSVRGRRSLSLPRSNQRGDIIRARQQHVIPENRIPSYNPNYGYIAQTLPNQGFVRNSPQRRTLETSYVPRRGDQEVEYRPIFKRGSLTYYPPPQEQQVYKKVSFPHAANRTGQQNWPTKNGFTQSPPTRRIDKRDSYLEDEVFLPNGAMTVTAPQVGEYITYETPHGNKFTVPVSREDVQQGDNVQNMQKPKLQGNPMEEGVYGVRKDVKPVDPKQILQEDPYGTARRQQIDKRLQQSNSFRRNEVHDHNQQIKDNLLSKDVGKGVSAQNIYDQRRMARFDPQYVSRQQLAYEEQQRLGGMYGTRVVHRNPSEMYVSKQQINENPYGSKQSMRQPMPESPYGSRQSFNVANPLYGSRQSVTTDPIYVSRQVTVNNKVCDFYGKIHDSSSRQVVSPTYGQVQETGVLYGQLQKSPTTRNPQQNYQQNFVRGSRLTASANDMYKRHLPPQKQNGQNYEYLNDPNVKVLSVRATNDFEIMQAPDRPLPPIPSENRSRYFVMRRESARRYAPVYDGDTSSETSEVQRILQNAPKSSRNPGK